MVNFVLKVLFCGFRSALRSDFILLKREKGRRTKTQKRDKNKWVEEEVGVSPIDEEGRERERPLPLERAPQKGS